jgi:hypothetical protein
MVGEENDMIENETMTIFTVWQYSMLTLYWIVLISGDLNRPTVMLQQQGRFKTDIR